MGLTGPGAVYNTKQRENLYLLNCLRQAFTMCQAATYPSVPSDAFTLSHSPCTPIFCSGLPDSMTSNSVGYGTRSISVNSSSRIHSVVAWLVEEGIISAR